MNCSEVQPLLSAYFDEELSDEVRDEVDKHLVWCDVCADEMERFERLSAMTGHLDTPAAPERIWCRIEEALDSQALAPPHTSCLPAIKSWFPWSLAGNVPDVRSIRWVLAASTIILFLVGWIGYRTWTGHGEHAEMAGVFHQYLEVFHRDPLAAQKVMLASYESHPLDADLDRLEYRPAVAAGMPPGYSVESIHVIKMPCCTCVQCLCQRSDGTRFAIFEHDDEHTAEWFGDRPKISTVCRDMRCTVIEVGDQIAANWMSGKRQMTVIGLRDTEELGQLAAWFDDRRLIDMQ